MSGIPHAQIYSIRFDLLGGKLNAAVNAIRVSRDYDLSLKIHWGRVGSYAKTRWERDLNHPCDIFSKKFIDKYLVLDYMSGNEEFPDLPKFRNYDELRSSILAGDAYNVRERIEVFRFPWEDSGVVSANFSSSFWDHVPLSSNASSEIDKYEAWAESLPQRIVGIHVRRGDIIHHPITIKGAWRGMYFPDEVVDAALEVVHSKGHPVRVFCADNQTIERLAEKNSNVVFSAERDLVRGPKILNDFIDIYAISKCTALVSSGKSAFSAFGSNIGGVANVNFYDVVDLERLDRAVDLCYARLLDGVGGFISFGDLAQTANYLLERFVVMNDRARYQGVINFCAAANIDVRNYVRSLRGLSNFSEVSAP